MKVLQRVSFSVLTLALIQLTGCGFGNGSPAAGTASTSAIGSLSGKVFGGQQPVVGAHVYLFAAGTTAYGAASTSLITGASSDSVGGYVLTDSNGNFNVGSNYTCTAGQQVYMYALGGNPGSGANSMSGLLAVLGTCPGTGTLAATVPTVLINEVSTIAAAYALAGFAVDPTHISSSGTTGAVTAIANAFANAGQMYKISASTNALATTPAGNGTVPQALLDTLADILAACINSSGPSSPLCTTLKTNAANGATQPTDTAMAAINIAHNPGANVAALYGMVSATGPFQPTLTSAPADFTVTLTFSSSYISGPKALAVDVNGKVWFSSPGISAVVAVSPLGVETNSVSNAAFIGAPAGIAIGPTSDIIWFTDTSFKYLEYATISTNFVHYVDYSSINPVFMPYIAIDGANHPLTTGTWNGSNAYFYQTPTGGYSGATGVPGTATYATAVDTNGFFWITDNSPTVTSGGVLGKFQRIPSTVSSQCTGTNYARGTGVVIDSANNAWVSDFLSGRLVEFANSCTYTTDVATIASPTGLAIDGNGVMFTVNAANKLGATNASGTVLSPATGYTLGVTGTLAGPVVDNAGNVWLANTTGNLLHEVIGVATPVVTPLSLGALNSKLAQKP